MRFNNDFLTQANEQERIRRGSHDWKQTGPNNEHGLYIEKRYKHQEYPKMLGTWPRPVHKHFLTVNGVEIPAIQANERYEAALREWDAAMTASVVNSKFEESEYLKNR